MSAVTHTHVWAPPAPEDVALDLGGFYAGIGRWLEEQSPVAPVVPPRPRPDYLGLSLETYIARRWELRTMAAGTCCGPHCDEVYGCSHDLHSPGLCGPPCQCECHRVTP